MINSAIDVWGSSFEITLRQSSRKTFLATSPVGQVIDQAHLSETKSTCPVGLVAGNIH